MVQKISLIFLSVFLFANAAELKVQSDASPVTFLAIGKPSLLKIKGEGAKAEGSLNWEKSALKGEISVPLQAITTGIGTRDKHMKEKYLEIEKPGNEKAVFKFSGLDLGVKELGDFAAVERVVKGKIKIHGVEKEIDAKTKIGSQAGVLSGHFELELNISDFNIAIPSFSGITVAQNVNVSGDFVAKK